MSPRSLIRLALLASPLLVGCDVDTHKTATGQPKQAAETTSPTDPGKVNAGGPGAQGETPK